jgi:hypothetical protein
MAIKIGRLIGGKSNSSAVGGMLYLSTCYAISAISALFNCPFLG